MSKIETLLESQGPGLFCKALNPKYMVRAVSMRYVCLINLTRDIVRYKDLAYEVQHIVCQVQDFDYKVLEHES